MIILLFGKFNSVITFLGPTNSNEDLSADYIAQILLPHVRYFVEEPEKLSIDV